MTRKFPPFELDSVNQCLWRHGGSQEVERILLTPKAFAVLSCLVEHSGRLVTQDELLEAVWPDTFVQPEVLKYQIADVRSALGDHPKNPVFIETLPRRGYRFIASVMEGDSAQPLAPAIPARGQLVGRDHACGALHSSLRKALRGQRRIVFITGDAGIGKTALVEEFQHQVAFEEPSIRIARGQCVEGFGGAEAYYPMLDALGQLCRGSEQSRVVETLAAKAPTWLVQFPALLKREHRQTLQQEILGATRDRMLREIQEALDALASEVPLLLVLEDLQWADPSTVDLISALARRQTAAKLMLIATKLPVGMVIPEHPLKTLKRDLLVHHLCEEITLSPLAKADVAEYLGARSLGGSLRNGFAELIHGHSEGNPLFMVAALDDMTQRGLISREKGTWHVRVPLEEIVLEVPETLRQMIEAQIEHLSTEEQRILEFASVLGPVFSAAIVAMVMNVDGEAVAALFKRLSHRPRIVCAAVSQQSECFRFRHALYREVFQRRQTAARRASSHRRVAEWAEAHWGRSNEFACYLADHFEQGADWPRAVKYLRMAAETAAQSSDSQAAAAILRHALESASHLPTPERNANESEILEKLAAIRVASGEVRALGPMRL